jgi:hypothetical protein
MKTLNQIVETNDSVEEMMAEWLELNPMPEITDLGSFQQAVNKAFWALKSDEASTVFSGEEYPLQVSAYKWNIEQAIINRDSGETMLQAGLDYVHNLTVSI